MVSRRRSDPAPVRTLPPPATTLQGREQQLVAAATDLAEQQLHNGTASAQVITHFLKLGSTREQLEQERLARENILLGAKAEAMETAKRMEVIYEQALNAMKSYAGQTAMELEAGDEEEDLY